MTLHERCFRPGYTSFFHWLEEQKFAHPTQQVWSWRYPARKTAHLRRKAAKASRKVRAIAWAVQKRLCVPYWHLYHTGKAKRGCVRRVHDRCAQADRVHLSGAATRAAIPTSCARDSLETRTQAIHSVLDPGIHSKGSSRSHLLCRWLLHARIPGSLPVGDGQ